MSQPSRKTTQPGSARRRTAVRAWTECLVLALIAFQTGTWIVQRLVPADPGDALAAARQRYAAGAAEAELVVIGSSRVEAGLDAGELERSLRTAGRPVRVLNYGVSGLRGLEQTHVLREVLAQRGARLRWVVLEAWPPGITIRRNTDYSTSAMGVNARAISWHTTDVTRRALVAIAGFDLPLAERLDLASHHLDLWARRTWNLGLASERLPEPPRRPRTVLRGGPVLPGPGMQAGEKPGLGRKPGLDGKRGLGRKWKSAWSADQYARRATRVAEDNLLQVDLDALDLELFAERERLALGAGVQLIYLTMPGETGSPEVLRMAEAGHLDRDGGARDRPPLLHLNDPVRYPELFDPALRKTPAHLNPEGAEVFSRLLAKRLLELGVGR